MLPTSAAQENLARLLRSKLSGEARKCIFVSTYNNIEELIGNLKRVYAPAKSVYQLQGELGDTYIIQCFIRGLRPELEIRVKTKETFQFVDFDVTGIINKILLL